MSWVLIVLVLHVGGVSAMTSADFKTQGACEEAARQWTKDFNGRYGVKALCHPK